MGSSRNPILTTKLNAPLSPGGLVARPRLFEMLDRGLERKLTLVCAPAGYGKSTLVSEWVHRGRKSVAWLSLDERDNDPTRFLGHLIAALQTVDADLGADALDGLHSSSRVPIESILSLLINDLAAAASFITLVLDDYHLLEQSSLHEAMFFFLQHMPGSVHVVILSRVDPPLRLARLRARRQLEEIREADLRFSSDEAVSFLFQEMGPRLDRDAVEALNSRTEGWIAGLQLAALSMKRMEDTAAFLAAFSGTHEYIVDYLTDEVLDQQPDKIRTFLLETSILDRLNGPLCAAVTEQDSARLTLERLREEHLFIIPLDNEQRWYRYHALFADLLRKRLYQEKGEGVKLMHGRAAQWFEGHGDYESAVEHALQAATYDYAIDLVETIAQETLIRTEFVTFLRWAEALPEELILSRPRLCVYYASALVFSGRNIGLAQSLLEHAVQQEGSDRVIGQATFFQAVIATLQGDVQTAVRLSQEALEILPDDEEFLRSLVTSHLGVGYLSSGDVEAAGAVFSEAADMGLRSGSYLATIMASRRLAEISILKGDLHGAWSLCEQALRLAVGKRGDLLPVAGLIQTVQGDLLREWNDLPAALEHLESGLELILRWSELLAIDDYIALARVRQAQNDAEGAAQAITMAGQIARNYEASRVAPILVSLHQCRLWIAQGNLNAAARWADEYVPLEKILAAEGYQAESYHHLVELEGIILARLYLARDDPERALAILDPLNEAAERLGRGGAWIEVRLLQALSHHRHGDEEAARTALGEALLRAEPQGYVRLFVDEGKSMVDLLTSMIEEAGSRQGAEEPDFPAPYVRQLLSALQAERITRRAAPIPDSTDLIEPLSERELQVLRLLVTHLTSAEIAEELYISPNTARFHIKNIYEKLGVHRRADAVERARELGLL